MCYENRGIRSTIKPLCSSVKFGDVVANVNQTEREPLAAGLERFVGLEHIEPENLHIKSCGDVAEGTSFTKVFRKGQTLFGKRRAYQRKVAHAEFDGICSGDILVFEAKDPKVLLPELLPFICQTERFFQYAVGTSAGSLSPRTSWTALAKYEFPLPPLEEQRRIAEILWAADDTTKCYRNTFQKLQEAENATINACMPVGIAFRRLQEGYKSPVVQIKPLSEICNRITDGVHLTPKFTDEGVPFLLISNLVSGTDRRCTPGR